MSIYKKLDELRKRYYKSAAGKEELLTLISEAEVGEQVYNSNAIENSTLTLDETEKILLKIDLDRYISERELFEARNLAEVLSYIDKKSESRPLTPELILFFHKILLSHIRDDIAGRFRQGNEFVRVGSYIAPAPWEIEKQVTDMITGYMAEPTLSIIKRIAAFHLEFEHIHPFIDGNGRIGRVLNNFLLIKEGYVPINIKFIDRDQYYDAFREYDRNGKTGIMEEIVGKALTDSYHKRLAYLEGKEIMTLNEYSRRMKISHSNLINKAKRQTIEAFMEKGIWKIGM
ncbi:MAG: Fic family protein [Spirochaetales bacterium]|nr:Fic family protein [Spirochaetales bacterium]